MSLVKAFGIVELEHFLYIVLCITYLNDLKHILSCQSGNLVKESNINGKDGQQQQEQQQQQIDLVTGKITVAILICSMCSYL